MQVFLELSGHPKANVQRVVLSRTTIVGRSRECGLQIASSSVSRKHCELRVAEGSVSVVDLGSSNGTFIDAERLSKDEERSLPSGAKLNVGGVRFLVTFAEAARDAAPSPALEPVPLVSAARPQEPSVDQPILRIDDDPVLDDEPILEGDILLFDEPSERPAASRSDETLPVQADAEPAAEASAEDDFVVENDFAVEEEPDLSAMFADEPVASTASEAETAEAAQTVEDEPILVSDEDDAFAFLMDDEPAPVKAKSDSRLGAL